MSIFSNLPEKRNKPSPWDINTAKHLLSILRKKRKLTGPISMTTWSKQIQLLRKHDGIDEKEIKHILEWLNIHLMDEYVPVIISAKSFRAKFVQLQLARERALPTEAETSPLAKKIVERLSLLHWPKGSKQSLAQHVQTSINEVDTITRKIKLVLWATDETPSNRTTLKIAKRIYTHLTSHQFVEMWWSSAHNSIKNWSDWSGELRSFGFKWSTDKANKMIGKIIQEYSQDESQLGKLLKLLEEPV